MPPKAKITRDMVIDAGVEVVREQGIENVNARTVSEKLGCSTQPVMYHFKKIEDMKKAIYQKVNEYHTEYITNIEGISPLMEIGLAYVRFGAQEKNLFHFLFQTNEFAGKSISELIDDEELLPVLTIMSQKMCLDMEQTKEIFRLVFLFVHGYASMFANNSLKYDENIIMADMKRVLFGTVLQLQKEQKGGMFYE